MLDRTAAFPNNHLGNGHPQLNNLKSGTDESFRLSLLEEAILLTLVHKPRYGIEIIEMIWAASDGRISINFGSLYPALNKLNKNNMIVETSAPSPEKNLHIRGGHRRKYYKLTEDGHRQLQGQQEFRTKLQGADDWIGKLATTQS